MSYDPVTAACPVCEKRIDLACSDYTVVNGEPHHLECATEEATCHCGHEQGRHYVWRGPCEVVTGASVCGCTEYLHHTGPDPKEHYPTDAELTAYNGPQ